MEANFENASEYVEKCVDRGAKLVCLPDKFAYSSMDERVFSENPETGVWFNKYRQLALDHQVWLSLGGFPETCQNFAKTG